MNIMLASMAKEEPSLIPMAFDPGIVDTQAYRDAAERTRQALASNPAAAAWIGKAKAQPASLVGEVMAKVLLHAPKSKAGAFIAWNEPWIAQTEP